jgi:exopolyphosphatase / guanosine-5'-triphosphate,3'-diphosphate pyrophosphatase
MVVAILDLGTNTFHLLIADVNKNGLWKKILKERITVKLGQGGINSNLIAQRPYQRGIKALGKFYKNIHDYKVKKVYAFGTAALRNARNGKDFKDEVKKKYGIDINFISGNEEATFIYYGVKQAIRAWENTKLVMDIGGGSVEFIIADNKQILWKKSYKLGAALLLDTFKPEDPLTKSDLRQIQSHFKNQLTDLFVACTKYQPQQLVGSAGSFETFSSMIRFLFPGSGSHYGKTEHPIHLDHFGQLYRNLIVSDKIQRNNMKGLIKMRVDMIVMAALLLKFVLDQSGIPSMKMSAYSLKEGALIKVIKKS